MSDCKECGAEAESAGTKPKQFCSDACRKRYKRTLQTDIIEQTDTLQTDRLQTDRANGQPKSIVVKQMIAARARRTSPDLLNWGQYMTADELAEYKCKHTLPHYHNRVCIPGDWDYEGVAV